MLAGLAILFIMPVLSSGRITRNGKADEIREEVEKITRSRKSNAEVRKKKRQKLSTKARLGKLKHISDSVAFADYMIQLQNVEVYADNEWPSYPVFSSLKEAKRAFKEPDFSGGYYRTRNNLRSQFRQPADINGMTGLSSWGYYTVRFIVDAEGNVIRSKAKTKLTSEIDEEMERVVRTLPMLKPAEFGGKKFPAAATMVIEYELENMDDREEDEYRPHGFGKDSIGIYFKIIDYQATWTPAISPIL